ncbi:MAG: ABC transporter ATP-binding protein [Thiohalophilus sp.]
MSVCIELNQLGKSYAGVTALDELSLSIERGEIVGLLGHNGAGKTTTIKLILGVIAPTRGSVTVLGHSPRGNQSKSLRMQWGYLPESVGFYEQLTGREVLEYFARLKHIDRARTRQLLEQFNLSSAADRRVKTYSKGMRQRLGLAQALLSSPKLLLLDEPTVGLDPIATRDFFLILDELRRQGTTIMLSSHVLPGIEQYVDRVAILDSGKLRAWGTLDELRHEAALPLTIRARGNWPEGFDPDHLPQSGISAYRYSDNTLTLTIERERKLAIMRELLADKRIEDIDVQAPSLETLYTYYNNGGNSGHA